MPEGLSDNLLELAERVQKSERYLFFKHVNVGRLLSQDFSELEHLAELTLASLIELITMEGCSALELGSQQAKSLCELLRAIIDEDKSGALLETSEPVPSLETAPASSVQSEIDLRQILDQLSKHDCFSDLRHRTLGEFWKPHWVPAPFEEMLTIQQLVSMDISSLFKKKMVSESRIECMVKALEAALVTLESASPPPQLTSRAPAVVTSSSVSSKELFDSTFFESLGDRAVLELVFKHAKEGDDEGFSDFLAHLREACTIEELLLFLGDEPLLPKLTKKTSSLVASCFGKEVVLQVRHLLQGPGVALEVLAGALSRGNARFDTIIGFLSLVVARSLCAQAVEYKGRINTNFWSTNASLLSMVIAEIEKKKVAALEAAALLDPKLHKWCKSHGGRDKKRMERRK